jgi:hypothetical protein
MVVARLEGVERRAARAGDKHGLGLSSANLR